VGFKETLKDAVRQMLEGLPKRWNPNPSR